MILVDHTTRLLAKEVETIIRVNVPLSRTCVYNGPADNRYTS